VNISNDHKLLFNVFVDDCEGGVDDGNVMG
jgi:hypothetical protein